MDVTLEEAGRSERSQGTVIVNFSDDERRRHVADDRNEFVDTLSSYDKQVPRR